LNGLNDFFPSLPLLPEASCKGIFNANLFFPESREQETKCLPIVRAICAGCPERKECLDYALREQIAHGIWAGTTPAQRGFGQGFRNRKTGQMNRSDAIRSLYALGRTPKEIAETLRIELAYVTQVLKRAAKLEGETQLLNAEKQSGESQLSSESAQ
jgi:WhiB family transcriptional regulator, redox-sensing transcriptional regulator